MIDNAHIDTLNTKAKNFTSAWCKQNNIDNTDTERFWIAIDCSLFHNCDFPEDLEHNTAFLKLVNEVSTMLYNTCSA